jgi:hypothetical protein
MQRPASKSGGAFVFRDIRMTTTKQIEMQEKLDVLFNEQRLRDAQRNKDASTFLSHTHNEEGGRFAKPQQVVGATPAPDYPAGQNWANDPTGVEPPLGIDVNAIDPVGEAFEVEASLAAVDAPSASSPDVRAPAATPNPKRRPLR